jgi:M6 family metalloprotease-like protein
MPPRPGVKIPREAVEQRHRMKLDVARQPIRDRNKTGIKNRPAAQIQALVSGTKKFAVVLMEYPDLGQVYAQTDFQEMLFGTWQSGSAHDYYTEASYGQLDLTGSVSGWFTAANNKAYYAFTGDLITEAAQNADPTVNFADFDNDGDGYVDCFSIIHSGFGMEETGDFTDIWSHMGYYSDWFGSDYITNDPDPVRPTEFIKINLYTIEPERSNVTNNGSMVCIGVFCHEWGHAFGLPDLYDTDGGGEGLGVWCLMAAGSWGGDINSPWTPVHLSAWPKFNLGWVKPMMVKNNGFYPVMTAEINPQSLQLWTAGTPTTEYFFVENRQKVGFDQNLPNPGLCIYHIDQSIIDQRSPTNEVNAGGAYPYGVALEQADGTDDLWSGTNTGDANDPYPGGTNNTAFDSLGTNPNSQNNAGFNTQCGVNQIPVSNSVMIPYCYIGPTILDVGVTSIDEPADSTVDAGKNLNPSGTVTNFGSAIDSTFDVSCTIDSSGVTVYTSQKAVRNIAEGATAAVLFDTWTPASAAGITYTITMTTMLATDMVPDNDSLSKTVKTVSAADVGVTSIDEPADTLVFTDTNYDPAGTVTNFGATIDSAFAADCTIDSSGVTVYTSQTIVPRIDSGATATVLFNTWTTGPNPGVTYIITMKTSLANDTTTDNDSQSKTVVTAIGLDAAVVSIGAPPDTVNSALRYLPKANVKNNGVLRIDLPVRCRIMTQGIVQYTDTQQVTNFASNAMVEVSFKEWKPTTRGQSTMTVWTDLTGDKVPVNDTLSKSIVTVGVDEPANMLPAHYALNVRSLNPTEIRYDLPRPGAVSVRIFDTTGKLIATPVSGNETAGYKSVQLSLKTVPAGIYFVQLNADNTRLIKKMLVVR